MLQHSPKPRRILLLGATGTIGRATARALADKGHSLTCLTRKALAEPSHQPNITYRTCNVLDPGSLRADGIAGDRFDALVSCLASRTGRAADAWAIDHQAHVDAMAAAKDASITHMVLLSAICVQKPLLAFQNAKLAFEAALIASGLTYTIVRPTAFFKSLSGQVERVKRGKPFLVFGDGRAENCDVKTAAPRQSPRRDRPIGFVDGINMAIEPIVHRLARAAHERPRQKNTAHDKIEPRIRERPPDETTPHISAHIGANHVMGFSSSRTAAGSKRRL